MVKKIILNKNYNSNTNDQDIALIQLASPVTLTGKSIIIIFIIITPSKGQGGEKQIKYINGRELLNLTDIIVRVRQFKNIKFSGSCV